LSGLSFFAQFEREIIRQRQAEGIAVAKAKGIKFGRPIKPTPDNFAELATQPHTKQLSRDEILKRYNLSQTTFYRRRAQHLMTQGKIN